MNFTSPINVHQINIHFPDSYDDFPMIIFHAGNRRDGSVPIFRWSLDVDRHLQSQAALTKFIKGAQRELKIFTRHPVEINDLQITFYHDCKFAAVSKLEIYHEPDNTIRSAYVIRDGAGKVKAKNI